MAYTLRALVGRNEINHEVLSRLSSVKLISLNQNVWLLPLTGKLVSELSNVSQAGKIQLLPELQSASPGAIFLAQELSQNGKVAYLEAEFFGGVGGQGSAGWQHEELLFKPRQAVNAINQALQWLRVLRDDQQDEFDMIELGQHRSTEAWAQQ